MSTTVAVTNTSSSTRILPPPYENQVAPGSSVTITASLSTVLAAFDHAQYSRDGFTFVESTDAPTLSNVAVGGVRLTGVADPSSAQDAATKAYVDAQTLAHAEVMTFGGGMTASGGADVVYFANAVPAATASSSTAIQYVVTGARTVSNLRLYVLSNTMDAGTVVTVMKNGSATTLTATITSAGTGAFSDNTHSVTFADGDRIALKVAVTATSTRVLTFTATVQVY